MLYALFIRFMQTQAGQTMTNFVAGARRRAVAQAGQGSVEYLGIVVAVVILTLAIIAGMDALGTAINAGLTQGVGKLTEKLGGGGA